jgi:hypothetical protein
MRNEQAALFLCAFASRRAQWDRRERRERNSFNPSMLRVRSAQLAHVGGQSHNPNGGWRTARSLLPIPRYRLLSLWYACSSTVNNRILFAGSKVKSFPWVKAGACLPLCCRGDACTSFRLDVGQRVQVNSLRCISSSPKSGSSHLCDQHGIAAIVVWPVWAMRSR